MTVLCICLLPNHSLTGKMWRKVNSLAEYSGFEFNFLSSRPKLKSSVCLMIYERGEEMDSYLSRIISINSYLLGFPGMLFLFCFVLISQIIISLRVFPACSLIFDSPPPSLFHFFGVMVVVIMYSFIYFTLCDLSLLGVTGGFHWGPSYSKPQVLLRSLMSQIYLPDFGRLFQDPQSFFSFWQGLGIWVLRVYFYFLI